MNIEQNRIEPVTPATPETLEQIQVGSTVEVAIGTAKPLTFKVTRIEGQRLSLRITSKPGPGKRWTLRSIPREASISICGVRFRKMGAGSQTLQVTTRGA